jgi:hypothetical protein
LTTRARPFDAAATDELVRRGVERAHNIAASETTATEVPVV